MFYRSTTEPYDTDLMAKEFLLQFSGQAFTAGQLLAFQFLEKKMLSLFVKSLEGKWPLIVGASSSVNSRLHSALVTAHKDSQNVRHYKTGGK